MRLFLKLEIRIALGALLTPAKLEMNIALVNGQVPLMIYGNKRERAISSSMGVHFHIFTLALH